MTERNGKRYRVVDGMVVELAAVEDAPAILHLQKLAYRSEAAIYNDYTIPPLVQTLEEMQADCLNLAVLKALAEGRIVGSVRARMDRETCLIGRLVVHPDLQNRGIGTSLLAEIESRFDDRALRFELFTGHKSDRNIYLYKKLGYRVFKTERVKENLELVYLEKYNPGRF